MTGPDPSESLLQRFIRDLGHYEFEIRQTDFGRYEIYQWGREALDPPVVLHIDDEQLARYFPEGVSLEDGGNYWESVAHMYEEMASVPEIRAIVFERGTYTVLTRTGRR